MSQTLQLLWYDCILAPCILGCGKNGECDWRYPDDSTLAYNSPSGTSADISPTPSPEMHCKCKPNWMTVPGSGSYCDELIGE